MRYAHHNLFKNLKRIKNSKDMTISRELIVSEIAKIIVGRPFEVRKILIGCGVNINENASRKELVYAVNFNMARNNCLRNQISALIANNQLPFDTRSQTPSIGEFDTDAGLDKYVNSDGGGGGSTGGTGSSGGGGMSASDWTQGISTLVGIGYGIWQTGASRKDARAQRQHEMELANMNSELMLKQMEMKASEPTTTVATVGGGTSMMTWVILGVGAVAVVVFAVMASRRNRARAVAPAV